MSNIHDDATGWGTGDQQSAAQESRAKAKLEEQDE